MTAAELAGYWPLLLLPALWVAALWVRRRDQDEDRQRRHRDILRRLAQRRHHKGGQT